MELWLPRSWGDCDGQLHGSYLFHSHCHSNSSQPQLFECGFFGSLGWASHSSWGLHLAHAYINTPSGLQTCRGETDFPSVWSIWTCPSLLRMFKWTVYLPCTSRMRDKEMSALLALCSQAVASETQGHCFGARAFQISSASVLAPPLTFPASVSRECNTEFYPED